LRVYLHARNPGGCCFDNDLGRYGGVKLILSARPLLAAGEPKTYMKVEGHKIVDFRFNALQVRSIFHCLSDSGDRWLKVGLRLVSV